VAFALTLRAPEDDLHRIRAFGSHGVETRDLAALRPGSRAPALLRKLSRDRSRPPAGYSDGAVSATVFRNGQTCYTSAFLG